MTKKQTLLLVLFIFAGIIGGYLLVSAIDPRNGWSEAPVTTGEAVDTTQSLAETLPQETMVSVMPVEIDDVLINPGIGFASFNQAGSADIEAGESFYPSCTIAYFRWYWPQIEPREGEYEFTVIDDALREAAVHDQTLAFRIMGADDGGTQVPEWLIGKGIGGTQTDRAFVPDFNDSVYLAYAENLIRALGERYNGNPIIDHIDVSLLGLWGEFHVSGVSGAPPIESATFAQLIDVHREAFPNTTLLVPINNIKALDYAVNTKQCGWRADCLGDIGGFSETWSHHKDMYPLHVREGGVKDAWEHTPVVFETCWNIASWVDRGWDVDSIFAYALDYHCSVVNAKSDLIPQSIRSKVEDFQRRVGYRLVLRSLQHPSNAVPGAEFAIDAVWENIGVAPPYKPYRLAYRLRSSDGETVWVGESSARVETWLPGAIQVHDAFLLPAGIRGGEYELDVAVLSPDNDDAAVQLAIAGRRADGWYALSSVFAPVVL